MGHDHYCVISGTRYFCGRDDIRIQVESTIKQRNLDCPEDELPLPSEKVLKLLEVKDEDIAASNDYVLITPCSFDADGTVNIDNFEPYPAIPNPADETNVTSVFGITAGDMPDYGGYVSRDDAEMEYILGSGRFLICRSCYHLVYAWSGLCPHQLYKHFIVKAEEGGSTWVDLDLGPVGRTLGQYVDYVEMIEGRNGEWGARAERWSRLLTQEDKTVEEIMQELWFGKGNLWCFARPDRFPIAEAAKVPPLLPFDVEPTSLGCGPCLSRLPIEISTEIARYLPPSSIVTLLGLNKSLRARLLPSINSLVINWLSEEEPWTLPVYINELNDEWEWWVEHWKVAGYDISMDETEDTYPANSPKLPWLAYIQACRRSLNIKNRKRIFHIIEQLAKIIGEP